MSIANIKRNFDELQSENSSSLKKQKLEELNNLEKIRDLAIFDGKSEVSTSSFESLYNFNFQNALLLKEQISIFEDLILSFDDEATFILRQMATKILNNGYQSENEKLIELGCLYFFLDRDRLIDFECSSFTSKRFIEIQTEASAHLNEMNLIKEETKLAPNGALHYLTETFTHMIISSEGIVNLGGIYAVERWIRFSSLRDFFCDAHAKQIHMVVSSLCLNSNFRALLATITTIHPAAEIFLRLDLKCPKEKEICSVDIHRGALLSLFAFLRQKIIASNCVVISFVQYLLLNDPAKLYRTLILQLESGNIVVDDIEMPFESFMNDFLIYQKAIEKKCFNKDSTEYSVLNYADQEGLTLPVLKEKKVSLRTIFPIKKNAPPDEKVMSLRKLYSSFFYSHLQNLFCFSFQFRSINTTEKFLYLNDPRKDSQKLIFLNIFFTKFKSDLNGKIPQNYLELICKKFEQRIIPRLWMSNDHTFNVISEKKVIYIGSEPTISRYEFANKKQLIKYKELFSDHLNFYSYLHGILNKIESISELGKYIKQELEDFLENAFIQSKEFMDSKKHITKWIADSKETMIYCIMNLENIGLKGPTFSQAQLRKNDEILIPPIGGSIKNQFKLSDINYQKISFKGDNLLQTIKGILKNLKNINTDYNLFVLPCENDQHSFPFYYIYNKDILENDIDQFFQEDLIDRSHKALEKISQGQIESIQCSLMSLDENNCIDLDDIDNCKSMKEAFEIVSKLLPEKIDEFESEFLTYLNEINIEEVNLSQLFDPLKFDSAFLEEVRQNIIKKRLGSNLTSSISFAKQLLSELRSNQCSIPMTAVEIERRINDSLGLPRIIVFGDSNYGFGSEGIDFIFRYNPLKNRLDLYERDGTYEMKVSKDESEFYKLSLYLPPKKTPHIKV